MKKLFVLFTAMALTATVFYGCAAKNNTPEVTTTTTVAVEDTTVATSPAVETTAESVTEAETTVPVKEAETHREANGTKANVNTTGKAAIPTEVKVSRAEARATVLKHAGVNESEVKRFEIELDKERRNLVYEVEFNAGKHEYDYEVDAETGKVLKAEKEFRD
jgi:uncharacterized membrane protein YkoI